MSDDSAWEGDDQESSEEEEEDYDDEDDEPPAKKRKPAPKKKAPAKQHPAKDAENEAGASSIKTETTGSSSEIKPISRRPKKLRRAVITEEEIQAESSIPSYQRLTVNGGYAATASHRRKIALANAGKQPWNKGKNRSEADKAKIKAAVNARNRRQLLANLESVGMTEEEHTEVRQQIKKVREILRKARLTHKKNQESEAAAAKSLARALKAEEEAEKQAEQEEAEIYEAMKKEAEKMVIVPPALNMAPVAPEATE